MAARILRPQALTREAFAPFGEVIETQGAEERLINAGTTTRYHDLARVDVEAAGGRPLISIFRGQPFASPVTIAMFERHPLGSQAFYPLSGRPWLAVVAKDDAGRPGDAFAFLATATQGVNYARGVWHHPLLSLEGVSDFLVVDRGGEDANLEEQWLESPYRLEI
ncbi:ureidoglycolate lyase [Jiella endophytica]|uniref:Ureidoglycolate lyase n=1 Tax=Jiella endophytica TaxID=2558362 RepID=A0A4Y8RPS2_9HYPH|nr:ureidoglycolate lyase [Jiella endophytica]TFF24784.1 ureidoglycolate lyase [Jiella endophytica]